MSDKHEAVNIFPSHVEAEAAVLDLQKAGFDMQKISIIGKDYQTAEHIRGFLTWKDTAKAGAGEAGYWAPSLVGCLAFSQGLACCLFQELDLLLWLDTLPECWQAGLKE